MLLKFLIWLDVMVFKIITFGNARSGETISAAAWSLYLDGKWQGKVFVPLIDFLFYMWEDNHCQRAYEWQIDIYRGKR